MEKRRYWKLKEEPHSLSLSLSISGEFALEETTGLSGGELLKGPGSEAECHDIEEEEEEEEEKEKEKEEEVYYIFNFSSVTDILTSYELEGSITKC
jgi:negative regulator of genetic competence, sporulation and motility